MSGSSRSARTRCGRSSIRVLLAIGLLLLVTMITYIGREGYYDAQGDNPLTFIDALYYSTVTITTTGYGDIVPTPSGRG